MEPNSLLVISHTAFISTSKSCIIAHKRDRIASRGMHGENFTSKVDITRFAFLCNVISHVISLWSSSCKLCVCGLWMYDMNALSWCFRSGSAHLVVCTDLIFSTRRLGFTLKAKREFCPWEIFSWSDVNPRIPSASRNCSSCGRKGRAGNFYPAPNFIFCQKRPPRVEMSRMER